MPAIPDKIVGYFFDFLEDLLSVTGRKLYRYITPRESAFWVAYSGFDITKSETRKLSTTISPVLFLGELWDSDRPVVIEFTPGLWLYGTPVTYNPEQTDPITKDGAFPWEFEVSCYLPADIKGYRGPVNLLPYEINATDFIEADTAIVYVWVHRGAELDVREYRKAKTLPYYLYGKAHLRYMHTMLPTNILIRQLAIVTTMTNDEKVKLAFMYAWNRYWEKEQLLYVKPKYRAILEEYDNWILVSPKYYKEEQEEHWIQYGPIIKVCTSSMIPENVCIHLAPYIYNEILRIYSCFEESEKRPVRGETVPVVKEKHRVQWEKALRLYEMFPDRFKTVEAAAMALKWWHESYDQLVKYLQELRKKRHLPKIRAEQDPDAIILD